MDKARENGILLTGMSQFFHEGVHKGKPTVILGYSGIDTVNIEKAFKIWNKYGNRLSINSTALQEMLAFLAVSLR